jgi:hypothetical protein
LTELSPISSVGTEFYIAEQFWMDSKGMKPEQFSQNEIQGGPLMNPLNAMALALAICGGFATFSFMQFGGGLSLWAAFVAWASFFHAGGTPAQIKSTAIAAIGGSVLGGVTMFLITGTSGAAMLGLPVWAGLIVFVSAGAAVSLSRIPALADVPVMMHSLACVAAYVILNNAGGAMLVSLSIVDNAAINVCPSMLVGVGFGILTAKLAGALSKEPDAATA